MKTTATLVILICFNVLTMFGQQAGGESADWPKRTESARERVAFETLLKKRALKYNAQKAMSLRSSASTPSLVGTCNVITCGGFGLGDVTPNYSWGGFKTAVDGSTYAANVAYDCWDDNGTVDYSEGQYISYSNSDANIDTPGIISPSPDGGGFAIFSYKNEAIEQDLTVLPNTNYTVCFEIAVIPRYNNSNGKFDEFNPNLSFGIGSGGTVISDPLTYTHNDLNIHPVGDFPPKLTTATSGNSGFQNPGGWTEINPFWETVCITFKSDNSGSVNVFYKTGNPGESVVLVDGLRLSMEGYANPPKFESTVNNTKSVVFCQPETTNLNDYISPSSIQPSGSVLTWSTNVDPLATSYHLTNTNVTVPGTYYAFYYNDVDNCASPVAQLNLLLSDFDAKIVAKTDVTCEGDTSGVIVAEGLNGTEPYTYSINGGSNYQNSGIFSGLTDGDYTITVKDDNNCTVEVSATILSEDKENPIIEAPANYTIEGCDTKDIKDLIYSDTQEEISLGELQSALDGGGNASDDIAIDTITYIDEVVSSNSCTIEVKRTFTVTDTCGKTATDVQIIIIEDTIAPKFVETLPKDLKVECDAVPTAEVLTAKDNCSEAKVTFKEERTDGACDSEYTLIRTWTAADECGNSVSHKQTITVEDNTAPTFVEALPTDATAECDNIPEAATLTATDNCDASVTVSFSESTSGDDDACPSEYTITRTWTVSDCAGNETSHTQTITVEDNTAPTFVEALPTDATVECDNIPEAATLTATDNCDASVTVSFSESTSGDDDACPSEYTITRTWTVSDCAGNETSHTQTITVEDNTAPTFVEALPTDATAECDNIPEAATLTATDNCDASVTVSFSESTSGDDDACPSEYTITRTWTVSDCAGNETSHTQTITVEDNTAPTFVEALPTDATAECDNIPEAATLTATDNCDASVTVSFSESTSGDDDACPSEYTITRTWTVSDCAGNETSHTQTITVEDNTAPTFVEALPTDATAECDNIPEAATLTATDNCDASVTVSFSESTSGDDACPSEYTITRTWTVSDCAGNETSHTQTITVEDNTAPTFVEALPTDATAECDNIPEAATLTATDNCDASVTVSFSESTSGDDDACPSEYTITRTWTVSDCAGNETSHTQTITVEDNTAPTFVEALPTDATVECDNIPEAATLTATDNCDASVTVSFSESTSGDDDACPSEYTITRTWTVSDCAGNETSHTQTITVEDNTAPTFVEALPTDATAECDNIPEAATLTATDNCDASVTVSFSESTSGDDDACPSEYTITRTWTVSDCAGNETSHTQTITVEDNTAPTFVEALPADATAECDNIPEAATLTATDNCDASVTVSFSESTSGDDDACPSEYTITRTWTVSDCAGNETSHTQTITVEDNTAPTFVEALPADATVECDNIPEAATLTATDNCDASVTVAYDEQRTDGSCPSNYILVRTWSVIDCAGNTNTHVQNITVEDTTVPTIDVEANDIMIQCDGSGNSGAIQAWLDSNGGASASDNCGTVTWTNNYSGATSNCADPIEVIFTATDECGNTATTTATYTIMDETAPTIDIEASDLTVQCDGLGNDIALQDWLNANGGASATDDCSTITWSNDFTGLSDDCGATGSATVTFTVTDRCGNESSTTATFTIEDTTAPNFVEALPEDATVECDAVPTAETLTATDNCGDATVTFNETRNDGDCESNYTLVRTWTATDACGLETVHTQTITVQDTTAPTFVEALPENVTVECDAVPTAETLTATDNCGDATVTFNETRNDGDCESNYTLVRTWTATDTCGLETVHTQTITVQDTTAPTFVEALPEDVTVECDAVPTAETLTATDNCGDATVTFNETRNDGDCESNYTLVRTWTATDACGLETTHTQTITVQDTTAPTFVEALPENVTVECDAVPTAETLTATDNCGDATVTFNETRNDGDCESNYTLVRTWTATDACGLETVHTQTITVQDTTAPTFVEALPENVTVECDAVPTAETLTATDNCGDATVTFNETRNDGDCESNYTLVRTWTATDACGLETVHTQTITVQDTTAPTFVEALPENVTVECDAVPTAETLTATDNCGDATVTFNETRNDGDCESNYTLVRTWTATDACGLETVHTQTITVQDTTAPTFVEALPEDATVECNTVLPTAETLTATDNCDSNFIKVEYNEIRTDGSCGGNYILTRTWTAMDLCGNVAEHTQIITVQDTTAPIVTTEFESEITVNCGEIPSVPELEFEDNCASQIDVTFNETDTNDGSGSNFVITREWTVSDECDNTAIFTQTINVNIETNVTGGSTDLCIGDDFEYDLFQLLSGDYGTNGTWEVTSGNATLNENFFNPYELELGEYRFTYTDSEGECPSETEVIITLNDACIVLPCLDAFDPDQHIPKAVTANGDDNNDRFEIDVLDSDSECFDVTMELQIFNRWGALIYESKDYQNNWGGESHNSSVGSSGKVPTGTYYYILRLIENGELIASYAGPIYVGTK